MDGFRTTKTFFFSDIPHVLYVVEIFTDIDINISTPWLGRPAGWQCRVVLPPTAAVCCLAAYNCHTSPWTCSMLITVRYWLVDDLLLSFFNPFCDIWIFSRIFLLLLILSPFAAVCWAAMLCGSSRNPLDCTQSPALVAPEHKNNQSPWNQRGGCFPWCLLKIHFSGARQDIFEKWYISQSNVFWLKSQHSSREQL